LIFQTEKQLKEFGDKLPADKKTPIEEALGKLKDAHKAQDIAAIDKATAELTAVWQAASEELYKNQQAGPQPGNAGQPGAEQAGPSNKKDDEVTDVDFEEVK
jgi:molecular chaperone DnaK